MELLCFTSPAILFSVFLIEFPDENEASLGADVLKIKKEKTLRSREKHINMKVICIVCPGFRTHF